MPKYTEQHVKKAQAILAYLQNHPEAELLEILKAGILKPLFLTKDRSLLDAFADCLKLEIQNTAACLQPEFIKTIKVFNLLGFYCFTEPKTGEMINIPVNFAIQGSSVISYMVQRIYLTSDYVSSPYTAYGLIPMQASVRAQALLLFPGTGLPTCNGFLQTLLADTHPGGAVGHNLYKGSEKILQEWINAQLLATKQPVVCSGISLGGAMSMQVYINNPDKVTFVTINTPLLTNAERRIYENKTMTCIPQANNILFKHAIDPVSLVGHWLPELVSIYVHGNSNDFGSGLIIPYIKAHASVFSAQSLTEERQEDGSSLHMAGHMALKPIRVIGAGLTYCAIGSLYLFRAPIKIFSASTKAIGPEPLCQELNYTCNDKLKM